MLSGADPRHQGLQPGPALLVYRGFPGRLKDVLVYYRTCVYIKGFPFITCLGIPCTLCLLSSKLCGVPHPLSKSRMNQTCTDEHIHRRVGTPGKIHDMYLYAQRASVMYMVIGIGSIEPAYGCTPFSRYV